MMRQMARHPMRAANDDAKMMMRDAVRDDVRRRCHASAKRADIRLRDARSSTMPQDVISAQEPIEAPRYDREPRHDAQR